jgi:hypothetical protein
MNVQTVNEAKQKILLNIQGNGPSYPAKIAREMNLAPLFISAFMSELVNEQKLKMSSMKVGSSPLYVFPGQENKLENFTNYLGSKEKETWIKLKESKILKDQDQDPATRVALQNIKDFAVPFILTKQDQPTKYWRYFTISEDEVLKIIEPKTKKKEETPAVREQDNSQIAREPQKKPLKKKVLKESAYLEKIKNYFASQNAELAEIKPLKAREYQALTTFQTALGKQKYLVLIKEKKRLTEEDIALSIHKAQTEKAPVLILTPGTLDKEAQTLSESWQDLVKIKQVA